MSINFVLCQTRGFPAVDCAQSAHAVLLELTDTTGFCALLRFGPLSKGVPHARALGHLAHRLAAVADLPRRRAFLAALDRAAFVRMPGQSERDHDVAPCRRPCRRAAALC